MFKMTRKFIFVFSGIVKTLILVLAICGACTIYNSLVYRNSTLKRSVGKISVEAFVSNKFNEGRVILSSGQRIDNVIRIAKIGSLLACVRFKQNLYENPYLIIELDKENVFEFDDIRSFFKRLNISTSEDCFEPVLNFIQSKN